MPFAHAVPDAPSSISFSDGGALDIFTTTPGNHPDMTRVMPTCGRRHKIDVDAPTSGDLCPPAVKSIDFSDCRGIMLW